MAEELKPLRVKLTTFPGLEHIMILVNRKSTIANLKEEIQETFQRIFPYRSQVPISNIRKDNNKVLIPDWYPVEPVLQDNEEVFISHDLLATNCNQCLSMETPNYSYNGSFDSCTNQPTQTYQQGQKIDQTPKSYHGQMSVARNIRESNQHLFADMENIGLNPLDVSINSLVNRIMENEEKEVDKERREGELDESVSILTKQKVFENGIVSNVGLVVDEDQTVSENAKEETSTPTEMKEIYSENEIRDIVDSGLKKMEVAAENVTEILIEEGSQRRKKRKKRKRKVINNEDSFETLLTESTMTDLKESGIGSDSTVNVLTKKNSEVMENSEINPKGTEDKDRESHMSEDKERVPLATEVKENILQVNRGTEIPHEVVKDAGKPDDRGPVSDVDDASQQEYSLSQKSKRKKSRKRRKDQGDAKSISAKHEEVKTETTQVKKKKHRYSDSDREQLDESVVTLESKGLGKEDKDKEGCKNDIRSVQTKHEDSEGKSIKPKKKRHRNRNADLGWEAMAETSFVLEGKEEEERRTNDTKRVQTKHEEKETTSVISKKKRHRNADSDWEAMAETSSALENKEEEEGRKNDTKRVQTKHEEKETKSITSKKKRHRNADSDWEAMAETSSVLESKEEEEGRKNDTERVQTKHEEKETKSVLSKKKRHRIVDTNLEATEETAIAPENKDDDGCFKAPAAKKSKSKRKSMLQENQDSSQNTSETKTMKQKSKKKEMELNFDYLLDDSEKATAEEVENSAKVSRKEQPSFDYETDKEMKGIQSKIATVVDEIVTESDYSTTHEPLKFTKDRFRLKSDATSAIDSNSKKEVSNSNKEKVKKAGSPQKKEDEKRTKKKRKGNKELLGASDSATSSISFSDYKGVIVSKETGNKSKKEKSMSKHSSGKSKKEHRKKRRKSSVTSNTEKSVAKVNDWLSKLTDSAEHIPVLEEDQETVINEVHNETKIENKETSFAVLESAVAVEMILDDSSKESGNDLKGAKKVDGIMSSEKEGGKESTGKDAVESPAGDNIVEGQVKGKTKSPAKPGKESSEPVKCKQQGEEDTSSEKKGSNGLNKNVESENVGKGKGESPGDKKHVTSETVKSKQSKKEVSSSEKIGDGGVGGVKKNIEQETVGKGKGKSPGSKEHVASETVKSKQSKKEVSSSEKIGDGGVKKNIEQETVGKGKGKSPGSKEQILSEAIKGKQIAKKETNSEKKEKDRKTKNVEKEDGKEKSAENTEHVEEDIDMNDSFDEAVADLKFEALVEDGASLISSKVKQPLKKLSTTPTYVQKSLNGFLSTAQQKRFQSKKKAEIKPKSLKGKLNKTLS